MQVRELMTDKPRYISGSATLQEAARLMRDLDIGFLPIADEREQMLQGVVTDRDNKKLCGVISLGDVLRHKQSELAEQTAEAIVA